MGANDKSPGELLWQQDGHLTDSVVTAVADGQDSIVPDPALEHLGGCEHCARRIGEAAVLSFSVGEQIAEAPPVSGRHPAFPRVAVMVALLTAMLGIAPTLAELPGWLGTASAWVVQGLPMVIRGGALMLRTLPQGAHGMGGVVLLGSSAVLIATGLFIARVVSRALPMSGGLS
jgi:hypothetical protein